MTCTHLFRKPKNKWMTCYEEALHMLGRLTSAYLRNEFRVAYLRNDNPHFSQKLCTQHPLDIEFTYSERNHFYWNVMGAMYRKHPEEMEFWTNKATRRLVYGKSDSFWKTWACQYEIWKIVRMFHLLQRRCYNAQSINQMWNSSARMRATMADSAAVLNIELQEGNFMDIGHGEVITSMESGILIPGWWWFFWAAGRHS